MQTRNLLIWPVILGMLLGLVPKQVSGATESTFPADAPSRHYKFLDNQAGGALILPALDAQKALREDSTSEKGRPLRYAIGHKVAVDIHSPDKVFGQWQNLDHGMRLWRLRIEAPGAVSIDLAFKPFFLPRGAALYVTDANGEFVRGPYTHTDNPKNGEFWTPFVPGDVTYVEVLAPASAEKSLQLEIFKVNQAYRHILTGLSPYEKSGSCNVDVVCPEGNGYRDQIRAVARYSVNGGLCTGQLVNNTANDNKPYYITANHCVSDQLEANSVVVYWNYENPTCRVPGSGASATPIPLNGVSQAGGATLRATYQPADTTLLELNTSIPAAANPFWDGWDRTESAKSSAVVVHHPAGDEKRISFEDDSLILSNSSPASVPGELHWEVSDWDLGTTEPGSSGSGLLSPEKRLIGVLSGGGAACGNDEPDYFGRLSVAWEGGGSSATRVRDWLDTANSGVGVIDGKSVCDSPVVVVATDVANPSADTAINFTASVSSGVAPYTISWDVDNDGVTDRSSFLEVPGSIAVPLRYPVATSTNVSVKVVDASNCPGLATLAVDVSAPDIMVNSGLAEQVCGDGDTAMEPGETWQTSVTLTNVGGTALSNAVAQFAPGIVTDDDNQFGYRLLDSDSNAACRFQPVDMNTAPNLPLIAAGSNALDDGRTNALSVGADTPFRLFGQNVSQIYMSTNGYLATSPDDNGGDYENICGQFSSYVSDSARIHALFDDLVVQSGGGLKHQHFAVCPRPSDAGSGSQGCTVFEWRNLGRYVSADEAAQGNAVFQAILYDQSYEIVYQYLTADPQAGAGASIGIENAAQSDSLSYGCNINNQAPAGRAVCFFEPSAVPASLNSVPINFVDGAQKIIPDLESGQMTSVNVPIEIPSTAMCGASIHAKYVGTVDDWSSSLRSATILSSTVGNGGGCEVTSSTCAIPTPPLPTPNLPKDGMYWNPTRGGNGIGIFNVPRGDGQPTLFSGAWFSGWPNRLPTWYFLSGDWAAKNNYADVSILRFTQSEPNLFPTVGSVIGKGFITSDTNGNGYAMSWNIEGHTGMDKLVRLFDNSNVSAENHTGLWYNPEQSGWGIVIDDHFLNGAVESWMVNYLYDSVGQPTWTLGISDNLSGQMPQVTFRVHCPWCPNFIDFASVTVTPAGSQERTFSSNQLGLFGSDIDSPSTSTQWNREALPIYLLTVPLQ